MSRGWRSEARTLIRVDQLRANAMAIQTRLNLALALAHPINILLRSSLYMA